MKLINPRIGVMDKMILSKFIDVIGKDSVFLSIEDAIDACRFSLQNEKHQNDLSDISA